MSARPTDTELKAERKALIGSDALLSELVRQRGEVKFCFDEEDGWFVQSLYMHTRDAWMTLSCDEGRSVSPTIALRDAVKAHNEEVERQRLSGRCAIHQLIPDNSELRSPETPLSNNGNP